MNKLIYFIVSDDVDNRFGLYYSNFIQFLVIISLICYAVSTIPELEDPISNVLNITEVIVVLFFSIDYMIRVLFTPNRFRYIFSFYGLIDFISIIPFFLPTTINISYLRIFRIFKLLKYNAALKRFKRAIIIAKDELVLFLFISMIMLYISAVGIYLFENSSQPEQFSSVLHSFWWAVITFTTVGYGDMSPVTIGGKIFTFITLMVGLGVIAVPTGLITTALTQARKEESDSN